MKTSAGRGNPGPPSEAIDHLPQLLMRLGSRAFAYFGAVAAEIGLPTPVAMALQRLEPARPGPMNELAGAMGCDPSYVTWIADQLEAQGLAERWPSTHDRRVKVLALTAAGIARRELLLGRLSRLPLAMDQLSAEEAATLSDLLRRVLGDGAASEADACMGFAVRHHASIDGRKQAKRPAAAVEVKGKG